MKCKKGMASKADLKKMEKNIKDWDEKQDRQFEKKKKEHKKKK